MIPLSLKKAAGPLFCLSAAVIWGFSFVCQKSGAHIGTFAFNGIRTLLGGLVMIPVVLITGSRRKKKAAAEPVREYDRKTTLKGCVICGLVLFAGSNIQQHAFSFDIAAGKVGFITALYMILVPVFGLFAGRKPKLNVRIAVVLGITGLYLLCVMPGDFSVGRGELFALICAFCFAGHILVIDYFCDKTETLTLSCGQYLIAGTLSVICMFIFEKPVFSEIISAALPILYSGIMGCSFAFTFQIYGQKYTEPTVASLLLCTESLFSLVFGWLVLHDSLGARALIGCAIMFAGVIISQTEFDFKRKRVE